MFHPSAIAPQSFEKAFWFLFNENKILVHISQSSIEIPFFHNPSEIGINLDQVHYLGLLDENHCFCAEFVNPPSIPEYEMRYLRSIFDLIDEHFFSVALKSLQIVNWGLTHRFCGKCATRMNTSPTEYARICPQCGLTLYPRISPAIIVAITRGNTILLAKGKGWTIHSVIAGYVEAGETLEQTVFREAWEEVGIKVKNIRYFSSQPWAFSQSLMIGFTAEYDSGEIVPDGIEIEEARWFSVDQIPDAIPRKISISRSLIEWFRLSFGG